MRTPTNRRTVRGLRAFSVVGGLVVLGHVSTFGQSTIFTHYGPVPAGSFGYAVAAAGDVDLDGFDDVVVGAPNQLERTYVISGRTGKYVYVLEGSGSFGFAVDGSGDTNADGCPDIIVGDWNWGFPSSGVGGAWIYSGKSGNVLKALTGDSSNDYFGHSVSGAGDVNADGYADVIIGARLDDPQVGSQGSARVYSGKDWVQLHVLAGEPVVWQQAGWSVSGVGDIDNDGRADLLVGSYNLTVPFPPGKAWAYSGVDGSLIHTLMSPHLDGSASFGRSIRGAGDVDADGTPDIVVGETWWNVSGSTSSDKHGAAHVFSGVDGSVLYTLVGDLPEDEFGEAVSGADDLDGDGHADVFVGSFPNSCSPCGTQPGYARAFSGKDGSTLFTVNGAALVDKFGTAVSRAGDVNSDGKPDVIVGARQWQTGTTFNGMARVFSGQPLPLSSDSHLFSIGAGGTQALRLNAGPTHAGSLYLLLGTTSGAKPGIPAGLVILPLNLDAYLLYTLANPNQPPLSGSLGVLSGSGTALAGFSLPPGAFPSLVGLTANHAYVLLESRAVSFASNAVPVTFEP